MISLRISVPLFALLLAQAPALGINQVVSGSTAESVHVDFDDGMLQAMGRTWKATFAQDGATFVPFLGSGASRNYPVTFKVSGVHQGTNTATLASPVIEHGGDRITLARGPIRAEYVLDHGGVEQLFVLDHPIGEGALTVRVKVDTELEAVADGAAWRFDGPEGGVRYSAAFVIDAKGERLDLVTVFDGSEFEFVIPAEFTSTATWPIAIDPLLSSTVVDAGDKDQREPDVAYHTTSSRYIVVFEEAFSASDADIKSWLLSSTGTVVAGSSRYFSLGTRDTRRPRVACTAAFNDFVTVYTLHDLAGIPIVVRGRSQETGSGDLNPTFVVDAPPGGRADSPDIGGDHWSDPGSAYYTFTWRRESSAGSEIVVARGGGFGAGLERTLPTVSGLIDDQPTLGNMLTQAGGRSFLAFRRTDPATGLSEILGAATNYDNTELVGPFSLSGAVPGPYANPAISSGGVGIAMAAWEMRKSSTDRDILAARFRPPLTPPVVQVSRVFNLSAMEHVDVALDQHSPALALSRDRFVMSYTSEAPGGGGRDIRATTLCVSGGELALTEAHLALEPSTGSARTAKVACPAEYSFTGSGSRQCLTAYASEPTPGQGDISVSRHDPYIGLGVGVQYEFCQGEVNSTDLRSYLFAERFDPSQSQIQLQARRLPASVSGYFLASRMPSAGVIPTGSLGKLCLGGSIGRYALSVLNSGATGAYSLVIDLDEIRQPNGPVAGVPGETWFFQAWHRDVNAGSVTSNFTNAIGILIP